MINRIKVMRENRGLSQAALAAKLNTSAVSVSRYEREDGRVTLPLLREIAEVLQCDPLELLSEPGTPQASSIAIPMHDGGRMMTLDREEAERLGLPSSLEAVEIEDETMSPTLTKGDICIMDRSINSFNGDGIYRLVADHPVIRRLARNAINGLVVVSTDNHVYPDEGAFKEGDIAIAGRVALSIKRM